MQPRTGLAGPAPGHFARPDCKMIQRETPNLAGARPAFQSETSACPETGESTRMFNDLWPGVRIARPVVVKPKGNTMRMRAAVIFACLAQVWAGGVWAHSDTGAFAEDHHHDDESAAQVLARPAMYPATVRFDSRKIENIVLKVNAKVSELSDVYVGRRVSKGDILAEFESAELETLQRTYIETFRNIARVGQISMTAEEKLIEGRMNLEWRGLSADDVQLIEDLREPLASVPITAPVDGYVLEVRVVDGEIVNAGNASGLFSAAGTTIFRIARFGSIVVEAQVPEALAKVLRPGSVAGVWVGNGRHRSRIEATVDQISRTVNPATQRRTVRLIPVSGPGLNRLRDGARLNVSLGGES